MLHTKKVIKLVFGWFALWRSTQLFVIGLPRSGTTLLCRALNAHPKILQTNELGLLLLFYKIIHQSALGRTLDSLPVFSAAFSEAYKTEVVATLNQHSSKIFRNALARCAGRKFWVRYAGDKHPHHDECLDFILKTYPKAVFIYIVRNPCDVIHSIDRHEPQLSYETVLSEWQRISANYEKFIESNNGANVLFLKYEDFVQDPQKNLSVLLKKMNLKMSKSFTKELELIMGCTSYAPKILTDKKYTPNSGKFMQNYSSEDLHKMFKVVKSYMAKYGYEIPKQYQD